MKAQTNHSHRQLPKIFLYLLTVLFWIMVWQVSACMLSKELLLPTPLKTLQVLWKKLLPSREFWLSIRNSLLHISAGFLLGTAAGILLAMLSALHEVWRILFWFPIKTIQSIPVASFVILVLLWISSSRLAVVISFLMVLPIIYTHTLTGIGQMDSKLKEAAILFRVPVWKRLLFIYIPQILPHVCSACSLAAGMAWKSGIAAEIIGLTRNSIGNQLYQAKIYLLTPELFAWTIIIILLSIGCEWLIRLTARQLSHL